MDDVPAPEDIDWGSEDDFYVRDDAGRNPPPGHDFFYTLDGKILIIPEPAAPDLERQATAREAWQLVTNWLHENVDRIEDQLFHSIQHAADVAVSRAGYSDEEWRAYVDGVRSLSFDWFRYESFSEPIELWELSLSEPRGARGLWTFLKLNLRRLVRVRRVLFSWYAPHCGNPKHLDFAAELASATAGLG